MPEIDRLIGELTGKVSDLQKDVNDLFVKVNGAVSDTAYIRGKLDEGWHTPTKCPLQETAKKLRADVDDLQGWRKWLLGVSAGVALLVSIFLKYVLGK